VIPIRIEPQDRQALVEAALGVRKCDLVIENARIVNLFTGEIYLGDVGIYAGFIAHVQGDPDGLGRSEEPLAGIQHIDAGGLFLIPGLIDAHVHIESSMMTPARFTEAVLPTGTTTVITDPHEIANVAGVEAVEYMHAVSADLPMRHLLLVPSCVPSVPGKEQSGAAFNVQEIEHLLQLERALGLAEVMDYPGVLRGDRRMVNILKAALAGGRFIQGHAPFLSGRELSAYRAAGPLSDHESRTIQEVRDKIRAGIVVDARESSGSRNVEAAVSAVGDFRYLDQLTLCTDDREPEDILTAGHMNDVVRKAVISGLHPVDAIRCATLHTARAAGLSTLGAVAPGYAADLILTADLEDIRPEMVLVAGQLVAKQGTMVATLKPAGHPFEQINTVDVQGIRAEDFRVPVPVTHGTVKTRVIVYRDLLSSTTDFVDEELTVRNGYLDITGRPDLKWAVVINRHAGNGQRGFGLVKNMGIVRGAVGSTVAHDCHNLVIVYDNPENAACVAADIVAMGGGISCAADQRILERLPLPVGGLMSTWPPAKLAAAAARMKCVMRDLGLQEMKNPLLRVAFLTLAVIPNAKLTDLGMLDVTAQKMVPMFPEYQ
jgi:adenine deaminase